MTRDTVWQDDPPFAVGEHDTVGWVDDRKQIAPATDADRATDIARSWFHEEWINEDDGSPLYAIQQDLIEAISEAIKAEREQTIRELRHNYKCGDEYEAGLWSRRNIEAFFRDQEKE